MLDHTVPLISPQQLAAMVRLAVSAIDLDTLLRFTVDCIAGGRDITSCAVLQLVAGGASLQLRAINDQAAVSSAIRIGADASSPAGQAIASGMVVSGNSLSNEWFADYRILANGGMTTLLVPVDGSNRPFGLLAVYGTKQQAFDSAAVDALQAVATLIGSAVCRFALDEQVRRVEQQHRLLLEHTADAVLIIDAAGRILEANLAASRLFQYAPAELLATNLDDLLPAEDQAAQLAAFFSATSAAAGVQRMALANHAIFLPVELVAVPLASDRLQLIIRHFQPQQDSSTEILQSEEIFFKVFHSSAAATAITHVSGVYIAVNDACLRLMGVPRAAVIGHSSLELDFWADREQRLAIGRRLAEHGQVLNVEIQAHHYSGEIRSLLASLVLITLDGDPCVVTSFMDMTEQKQAAEMRRAREAAELASQSKSEFLSRMSHELRTPLNAILGFAQVMGLDPQSRSNREGLDHILNAGRHLLQMINEVLDISSIEQGRIKLQLAPLPLDELIEQVLQEVTPLAREAGLTLHKSIMPKGNGLVLADQARLAQVLLHLLTNAIRYNRPGGSVTLSLAAAENGRLRVSVSDTGLGIAAEKLPRLFLPFERLGAERTSIEGTGLGLLLSQRLMEALGSKIEMNSTLGVGSDFWFDLPAAAVQEAGPTPAQPRTAGQQPEGAATILYLEKASEYVNLVSLIVARWPGVRLVRSSIGSQELQLLSSLRPSLVLLDTDLPDNDTVALLRLLKADTVSWDTPVVLLSAALRESWQRQMLDAGASACLTKPLNVREFMRVVGGFVGYGIS